MKNPEIKTKLRTVLKAAIGGGLVFAVFTAFAIASCAFFGGYFFGGLYFYAVVPLALIDSLLTGHLSTSSNSTSDFLFVSYCVVINGLVGALVCAFLAALWQGFKKGKYEK